MQLVDQRFILNNSSKEIARSIGGLLTLSSTQSQRLASSLAARGWPPDPHCFIFCCLQRFSLLGSTGSIGTQTLDIIAEFPDKFELVALAAGSNVPVLAEQVRSCLAGWQQSLQQSETAAGSASPQQWLRGRGRQEHAQTRVCFSARAAPAGNSCSCGHTLLRSPQTHRTVVQLIVQLVTESRGLRKCCYLHPAAVNGGVDRRAPATIPAHPPPGPAAHTRP